MNCTDVTINSICEWVHVLCASTASDKSVLEESVSYAATQDACSCFRQQIFTKQRAKENVSLHKNKVGGKSLWKCCCAEFGGVFVFHV